MFNKLRNLTGIASVISVIFLLQSSPVWAFQYSVSQFPRINENPSSELQPLVIYAASSLKTTLDPILAEYSEINTQPISVVYGGSSFMLKQLELLTPMDILISANYTQVKKVFSPSSNNGWLCELHPTWKNRLALVKVKPNLNRGLSSWSDISAQKADESIVSKDGKTELVAASAVPTSNLALNDTLSFSVTLDSEVNWIDLLSKNSDPNRMERIAISDPLSSALGFYTEEALINSGHFQTIKDHLFYASNSELINTTLTSGVADFGVVFLSDATQNTSYITLGIFPETFHEPIIYSIGVPCLAEQSAIQVNSDALITVQTTNSLATTATTSATATTRSEQRNKLIEYLRSPSISLKFLDQGFSLHDSKLDNTSILKRFNMLENKNITDLFSMTEQGNVANFQLDQSNQSEGVNPSQLLNEQVLNEETFQSSLVIKADGDNSTSPVITTPNELEEAKPKLIIQLESAVKKIDNTQYINQANTQKTNIEQTKQQSPESTVDESNLEIENE